MDNIRNGVSKKALLGVFAIAATFSVAVFSQGSMKAMDVPPVLQPPADQQLLLEVTGNGVQIYKCDGDGSSAAPFVWKLQAPEAALLDRDGRVVGKHYVGPTWESTDGSSVVGEVRARDAGPDAAAIPWLLLRAKATNGTGVFSKVLSIQRLRTYGGLAPPAACGEANAGQLVRVPYSADYYFYGSKP
ncbi:MAG TPA: DUF3455 domain-containing protein [Steroidobacteraceae bacterium]